MAGEAPLSVLGNLALDPLDRRVRVDGEVVDLTRMEFDLLLCLMHAPKRVLTRTELAENLWGTVYVTDHAIEALVSRLRSKILKAGGPSVVSSVRGVGYRLGVAS
jgi:two-component system catabolic regulation response regulator CreB